MAAFTLLAFKAILLCVYFTVFRQYFSWGCDLL